MLVAARAFTLIELLIAVAIIAILAAIAVPNYLEAQVRAKVSRTHSDLRTFATAMESYRVDNNQYPSNTAATVVLTSPVSYLTTTSFRDPFAMNHPSTFMTIYAYMNFSAPPVESALPALVPDPAKAGVLRHLQWIMGGRGPDTFLTSQSGPADDAFTQMPRFFTQILDGNGIYDPTNGTVSYGDILRSRDGIVARAIAP